MPPLQSRVGATEEEPEEVSAMSEPVVEEYETEAPDAAKGGGRADAHRSIRGSSPHAPYNRHTYYGIPLRCSWCGRLARIGSITADLHKGGSRRRT